MTVAAGSGVVAGRQADLVLEGGGVKGIGLLGAVIELTAQGWTFPRVAGVSAGAIVGSLVAAYQHADRDVSELVPVMEGLDYGDFRDPSLLARFGLVGKGLEMLFNDGIYQGDYAVEWLEAELEKVGVRTWADLRIEDDPDTSLRPHERYRLVVLASDVSNGELVRLPWDYRRYGLTPDTQRVVDAVRASMSYPFFFRPAELRIGPDAGGGKVTLVDGGLLSNFPVEIFDRTDGRPARWPTIGLKLSARADARQVAKKVDGPVELAFAILHTLIDAHDSYHLDDIRASERTVFIDTEKVSTLDFDIGRDAQRSLYANGRAAARTFLTAFPPAGTVAPLVIPAHEAAGPSETAEPAGS